MSRPAPPSGVNSPQVFELADGTHIDLGPVALKLCEHYYALYPDDLERYGAAGQAWCDHDSRYLIAWALEDARAGTVDCIAQAAGEGRASDRSAGRPGAPPAGQGLGEARGRGRKLLEASKSEQPVDLDEGSRQIEHVVPEESLASRFTKIRGSLGESDADRKRGYRIGRPAPIDQLH